MEPYFATVVSFTLYKSKYSKIYTISFHWLMYILWTLDLVFKSWLWNCFSAKITLFLFSFLLFFHFLFLEVWSKRCSEVLQTCHLYGFQRNIIWGIKIRTSEILQHTIKVSIKKQIFSPIRYLKNWLEPFLLM